MSDHLIGLAQSNIKNGKQQKIKIKKINNT